MVTRYFPRFPLLLYKFGKKSAYKITSLAFNRSPHKHARTHCRLSLSICFTENIFNKVTTLFFFWMYIKQLKPSDSHDIRVHQTTFSFNILFFLYNQNQFKARSCGDKCYICEVVCFQNISMVKWHLLFTRLRQRKNWLQFSTFIITVDYRQCWRRANTTAILSTHLKSWLRLI